MDLHEDILVEILCRLPAKTIGRFRCVSKQWRTLLSRPCFIKTHLNRRKHFPFEEQSVLLLSSVPCRLFSTQLKTAHHVFDEMTAVATGLDFVHHHFDTDHFIQDVSFCDRLVLVQNENRLLLLINPTTNEIKELFAPLREMSVYGIGYDSVSDDHKVVTLAYSNDEPLISLNVYSVKNGTWKQGSVSSPCDHSFVNRRDSGVFLHGHIHWIRSSMISEKYSSVILAFDLAQEKFHQMQTPDETFRNLLTIGGCLCMFGMISFFETHIWLMKEYGVQESWTKFTIVDNNLSVFSPLCSMGKEQVVLVMDEDVTDGSMVLYSLKEGRVEDIDIVLQNMPPSRYVFAGIFIESLVSPHCIVG